MQFLLNLISFGLFFDLEMLTLKEMVRVESVGVRVVYLVLVDVLFLKFHVLGSTLCCCTHMKVIENLRNVIGFI